MKTTNLVIYHYAGEPDKWRALPPHEVPEWVRGPEVVADLVEGYIVNRDGAYYRAKEEPLSILLLEGGCGRLVCGAMGCVRANTDIAREAINLAREYLEDPYG